MRFVPINGFTVSITDRLEYTLTLHTRNETKVTILSKLKYLFGTYNSYEIIMSHNHNFNYL